MAVLGVQLVITLVTVSVIQKLSPYYSFARWLLCSTGLTRYLYPTNSELKSLMRVPRKKKTVKNVENGKLSSETFFVPKNLPIDLECKKVTAYDVIYLRYYEDYKWLVDFALYSAVVYTLTELFSMHFSLSDEVNLSMMWCMLVHGFAIRAIFKVTVEYFRDPESMGERSIVIVTTFVYLFLVMIILVLDEEKLETGLDVAYNEFSVGAADLLKNIEFRSEGPASKLILKLCIALWSSVIGALFVFPGWRLAQMHLHSLKYYSERRILQFILHLNFVAPLLITLLWIRPISRDYLTVRIFPGMSAPLLAEKSFESLRIALLVSCMVFRLSLMPVYLQAYLNMAYHRIELLKNEAGKITNIELQKKIASVFYCTCVVAIQYIVPLLLTVFFALMYKTLGGLSWKDILVEIKLGENSGYVEMHRNVSYTTQNLTRPIDAFMIHSLRKVFTENVYKGLLGFAAWWTCFSWFSSSTVGLLYHTYFST